MAYLLIALCCFLALLPAEASARVINWSAASGLVPWDPAIPEEDRFEVVDNVEFATLTPQVLHIADDTAPGRIVARRGDEPIGAAWSLQIDARVISSERAAPNFAFSSSVIDGVKQVTLGVSPEEVGFVGANGASWIGGVTYLMDTTDAIHRYDVQKVESTIRLFIDGSATPAIELPLASFVDNTTVTITLLATSITGTSEFDLEQFQVSTGVSPTAAPSPRDATRLSAAPNPFGPSTSISFSLDAQSDVQIELFDVRGRRVRRLLDAALGPGAHLARWDGRDDRGQTVVAGSYWVRLLVQGQARTHRLIRLP